jgi:hypothetical protein
MQKQKTYTYKVFCIYIFSCITLKIFFNNLAYQNIIDNKNERWLTYPVVVLIKILF